MEGRKRKNGLDMCVCFRRVMVSAHLRNYICYIHSIENKLVHVTEKESSDELNAWNRNQKLNILRKRMTQR